MSEFASKFLKARFFTYKNVKTFEETFMSHDQNDNSKISDKSSASPFDAAANKAAMLMREEIYGINVGHNAGDGHNHSGAIQNFAVPSNGDGHNHGNMDQAAAASLDKTNSIQPIGDGHNHNQAGQNAAAGADKSLAPIGLDGSALASMLQNGALTYQQAIAMSSPQLAAYLSSFRTNKPNA